MSFYVDDDDDDEDDGGVPAGVYRLTAGRLTISVGTNRARRFQRHLREQKLVEKR